jgi:hypothetical protein
MISLGDISVGPNAGERSWIFISRHAGGMKDDSFSKLSSYVFRLLRGLKSRRFIWKWSSEALPGSCHLSLVEVLSMWIVSKMFLISGKDPMMSTSVISSSR